MSPQPAPAGLDDPAPVAPAPVACEVEPAAPGRRFFHASPANLRPGQQLLPAGSLPPGTSPHADWYAEHPDGVVTWRMDKVWLWPTLGQARKWARGGDGERVYEVTASEPELLTECGHHPIPRLLRRCDCRKYGEQWHARSATVVRVIT